MALLAREELLAKLDETHQELLELLARLDLTEESASIGPPANEATAQRGGESEWSAKQQLAHMVEVERLWADWARRAAAGDPNVGPKQNAPDGQITGTQFTAHSHSLWDLNHQLADARATSLEIIRSIPDEALARTGHTHSGELTALQMLRALYRHDRMHIDQIAGREPSFQPRIVRTSAGS